MLPGGLGGRRCHEGLWERAGRVVMADVNLSTGKILDVCVEGCAVERLP